MGKVLQDLMIMLSVEFVKKRQNREKLAKKMSA